MDELEVDVVVLGGGMAGMTAAASLAQRGAVVAVLERGPDIGGSAVVAGGFVWSLPDLDVVLAADPDIDVERARALLDELPAGLEWIASLGVDLGPRAGPRLAQTLGLGEGHQIDVRHFMHRCRTIVEARGGLVATGVVTEELRHDGAVTGVVAVDAEGTRLNVASRWVVLATGGFQAGDAARREHLGPAADQLILRSNPHSVGDGLRLARQVGAAQSRSMGNFYGHLVASPVQDFAEADFFELTQYHSERGVLIGRDGRRFTNETLCDHVSAQAVLRESAGLAVLVIDEPTRRWVAASEGHDKIEAARHRGARTAVADTVDDLMDLIAAWDLVDVATARTTLADASEVLHRGPFAAMQVQPAITFTYGGVEVDAHGRVLRADGRAIPGLLAAGVDAGGLYDRGYAGGLAMALVTGRRVAVVAAP